MSNARFTPADDLFLREIGISAKATSSAPRTASPGIIESELRRQLAVLEEHVGIACALWQEEIGISARWKRTAFASFTGNVVLAFLVIVLALLGVLK